MWKERCRRFIYSPNHHRTTPARIFICAFLRTPLAGVLMGLWQIRLYGSERRCGGVISVVEDNLAIPVLRGRLRYEFEIEGMAKACFVAIGRVSVGYLI